MKVRSMYLWIFAFLLVAFAAIYQRMTGPTYPIRGGTKIGTEDIGCRLPRSYGGEGDAEVRMTVPNQKIEGTIELRRFRSNDPWMQKKLVREGNDLVTQLPHQPPAGKVAYRISLTDGTNTGWLTAEPVILRFKGDVPAYVMVPHIILMFIAMLFSTRAGFEALLKRQDVYWLTLWTTITLALGGLLLGPVVQKFAFNAYWSGWPFGRDLTDNKTIAAFLCWAIALWRIRKRPEARGWAVAASVVLFLVYMIPHSVLGSEVDYTAGTTIP